MVEKRQYSQRGDDSIKELNKFAVGINPIWGIHTFKIPLVINIVVLYFYRDVATT